MLSSVRSFQPLVGDADALVAAFEAEPDRWLPVVRRDGPDRYTLSVSAGAFRRRVVAQVGQPWRAGATRWRTLSWEPTAEDGDQTAIDRILPTLDGEIGLHVAGERVTLVLDARYRPPGGPIGAAADAVALNRVARITVERFLEEVGAKLGAEALLLDGSTLGR